MYYQSPNNQPPPNTYYPPPQEQWQQPPYAPYPPQPQVPPQAQRASRLPVKIVAIACLALGFALGLAGVPALGGVFVLSGFVAIFFI